MSDDIVFSDRDVEAAFQFAAGTRMLDRLRKRSPDTRLADAAEGRLAEIAAKLFLEARGYRVAHASASCPGADRGTDIVAEAGGVETRIQVKSTKGRALLLPFKDYGESIEYRWRGDELPADAFMLVKSACPPKVFRVLGGISASKFRDRAILIPKGCGVDYETLTEIRMRGADRDEVAAMLADGRMKPGLGAVSGDTWALDSSSLYSDPAMYMREFSFAQSAENCIMPS